MSLPCTNAIPPNSTLTSSVSRVNCADQIPVLKSFMPARTIQFKHFCLVTEGGYADIYKSKTSILCNDGQTRQFAMKLFRVARNDPERTSQITSVINELLTQQSLMDKDNINLCSIELLNVTTAGNSFYAIIMPWYDTGHVLDYVREQPSVVNKLNLVVDIMTGLKDLHDIGLIHGNLCPENIFVTGSGHGCIADIGVNMLIVRATSDGFGPIPPAWSYKAPEELLLGIRDRRTDVYSFACVVYALYVASPPLRPLRYPYFRRLEQIVASGHLQLLGPPEGMDEGLWRLLKYCWSRDPAHRPTMAEFQRELLETL